MKKEVSKLPITRRQALEERARRAMQRKWQSNPLLWLEDRLGEPSNYFKWSEFYEGINHQWDGDEDPLYNAWMNLANSLTAGREGRVDEVESKVALESATGTSKTFFLARLVYWFLDVCPDSLVVTSAPSETQLKLGLWSEIGRLFARVKAKHPNAKKWKQRLVLDVFANSETGQLEDAHHAVGFITGTNADEESANKARGFHRKYMLIILEECTGIPHSILTAFQNTCTGTFNFIVAVGNPDNEHDTLHIFSEQTNVVNYRISALDYPNVVLKNEVFAGAVSINSILDRTKVYGKDSPLWSAMVRGISPKQSSDALIRSEWIIACKAKEENPSPTDDSYNAVGVDVANSQNGDKAALVWGRGNVLDHTEEFQCPNATDLGYNVLTDAGELLEKGWDDYNTRSVKDYDIEVGCIGIDAVGIGVATVNAVAAYTGEEPLALQGGYWKEVIPTKEIMIGYERKEEPMYKFQNLRGQMFWELREDLRLGNVLIDLPKHLFDKLLKELTVIKYSSDGTVIQIESKARIKKRLGGKSPNIADAAAYWNWTRKGYRLSRIGFAAMSGGY